MTFRNGDAAPVTKLNQQLEKKMPSGDGSKLSPLSKLQHRKNVDVKIIQLPPESHMVCRSTPRTLGLTSIHTRTDRHS